VPDDVLGTLSARETGVLAAIGRGEVEVVRRPRVAILSTGDEVVDPSTPALEIGQVRDASSVALAALVIPGHKPDTAFELHPGALSPGQYAMLAAYAALMMGVCMLACVVPTRRALRVQPAEALRAD